MSEENAARAVSFMLQRGLVPIPPKDAKWVCLNAQELPPEASALKTHLICEQGLRPVFKRLKQTGYAVEAAIEEIRDCAGALIFAGRNRRQNERWIARAWSMVDAGAPTLIAGEKTSGIASLRKWIRQFAEIEASQSKHHAMVFSFRSTGEPPTPQDSAMPEGFFTAPGMFSADGVDSGSQMLASHFGEHIAGRVADFGCGWGYLGSRLLTASPNLSSLDCYEADWQSLQAARRNLSAPERGVAIGFHWIDLLREPVLSDFDWVVMNPPFHAGRAAHPAIGTAFVRTASKALKPDGRLLMVANRQLPYEAELEARFRSFRQIAEENGFKIIEAIR